MQLFADSVLGVVGGLFGLGLALFTIYLFIVIANHLTIQIILMLILLNVMVILGVQEKDADSIARAIIGLLFIGSYQAFINSKNATVVIGLLSASVLVSIFIGCLLQ